MCDEEAGIPWGSTSRYTDSYKLPAFPYMSPSADCWLARIQRRLLPVSTAIGAILLMAADGLCRYLSGERMLGNLLPVGVLTGLLGGPVFLWLLFRTRKGD